MTVTAERVVIVTGANSGIGFRAAEILADSGGYHVILACRSQQKAEKAVQDIKKTSPKAAVAYHLLDLADKKSVNEFADWFLAAYSRLDVLVNNAGILRGEGVRKTTMDGFEITFGTNHLGHFLLTMRLLEKMKKTAEEQKEARIINVSSALHDAALASQWNPITILPLDMDDLNLEKAGSYNWMQAYKNSKAANILFTNALSRSLEGIGVICNAMTPGFVPSTNVFREHPNAGLPTDDSLTVGAGTVRDTEHGGRQVVSLVTDGKNVETSGKYYDNFQETETSDEVKDVKLQKEMWMKSCEMLGVSYEHVLKH